MRFEGMEEYGQCPYCKDLNEEEMSMEIAQLFIEGSYYNYNMPIRCCPYCGTKLERYKDDD